MASEVLAVPEGHLADMIAVIREGLRWVDVETELRAMLLAWCDDEQDYLVQLASDE